MDDESLRDTQTQYEYGRDSQMDDESLRETQTQYDYGRDSQTEDGYPKDSQMESGDYGRDSQTEDGYRRDSQTQYDYGRDSHTQDGYPRDSQMNDSFWNRGESVSYEPRDGYGSSASRSVSPDEQPKLDPVTASLLDQLREELEKESKTTIFTCGGTIPITKPDQSPSTEDANDLVTSEPITVRWDPASANALAAQAKLVLPLEPETRENLQRLLRDTEPASFGYHGKNVYDEAYRKALKMDTAKFATTFNPYELGIIDTIAQVLLPSTPDDRPGRAVKAELYKLNVSFLLRKKKKKTRRLLKKGSTDKSPFFSVIGLLEPVWQIQAARRYTPRQLADRFPGGVPATATRGRTAANSPQGRRDDL